METTKDMETCCELCPPLQFTEDSKHQESKNYPFFSLLLLDGIYVMLPSRPKGTWKTEAKLKWPSLDF